ncbi:MAG: prepilin-type N-terminal cleavage/methylation domain-containing protein [Candidatus Wallbacteria bacterium]|nr:prepilin-type N-terminal cleavage/methylation domain-containing protein [Candidatus Wallbacteria bacterium]
MNRRNYRSGFSLIELLIVVAIIAALIGVAVPYFQSNLSEAQVTKAKQDLDTIRNAINLYESRYRALTGENLDQILGQTMQEIPKDPWGSKYLLDANLGIIWSYGADAQPGGATGGDVDQVFKFKPSLQLRKAELDGPYSSPKANVHKITLSFTKPYSGAGDLKQILLVTDSNIPSRKSGTAAGVTFNDAAKLGTWSMDVAKAVDGIMVLKCTADPTADASQRQTISQTMYIDLLEGSEAAWTVKPANTMLLGYGATPETTSSSQPKVYKGYPGEGAEGDFNERGAKFCDNGLGARIERKQ